MTTPERLTIEELLNGISLRRGRHATRNDGVCAMEAAAWMAGEPHSDHPQCVCPIIAAFLRSWNDALPAEDRDRLLKPLVPKVLGTRSTPEVARRRSLLALDWFVRVFAPAWLALTPSLEPHATALRSLAEIVDDDTASTAAPAVQAARSAADSAADSAARSAVDSVVYLAARSAADSAANSAAYTAVYLAARSAACSAAYRAVYLAVDSAANSAAYSAAVSAAVSAARSAADSAMDSAARLAARLAARSALAPTVTSLQQSASELVLRMVAVTEDAPSAGAAA